MNWWVMLFLLGVNTTLWSLVACARLAAEQVKARRTRGEVAPASLTPDDVAILIPAHNEEVCIRDTLRSATRLLPASNVHVIADGCTDLTATIARQHGANVLELDPPRGKAGGIEAAVEHFRFRDRFEVLLITDADTELSEGYLDHGLRLLDDPEMVALAGYAYSAWQPSNLPFVGRFLIAYRTRVYAVMQFLKYGQTWRHTNVAPIVPGFASMYRTRVLPEMDLNPAGLVIEDFNMTFELHRKRLGKIAFGMKSYATAQDPDNLRDYYKQITRWSLGFWQTLRRHGFWRSRFSLALAVFLVEVLVASVTVLAIALGVLVVAVTELIGGSAGLPAWISGPMDAASSLASPTNIFLFVVIPDYLLTVVVAIIMRRPSLLVYGPAFLLLRIVDATTIFWSLVKLARTRSTGRWTSPTRRVVGEAPAPPPGSPDPGGFVGGLLELEPALAPVLGVADEPVRPRPDVRPVVRDALLMIMAVSGIAALTWALQVPFEVLPGAFVAALVVGCVVLVVDPLVRRATGRARRLGATPQFRRLVAATLALAAMLVVLMVGAGQVGSRSTTATASTAPSEQAARPSSVPIAPPAKVVPAAGAADPVAPPARLSIPAIGVLTSPPVSVRADAAGPPDVPTDPTGIGWWEQGPKPGEAGSAVFAGNAGPGGVLSGLGRLELGDEIVVERVDGRRTTFLVDSVHTYAEGAFPSAQVYGSTANAQLRLVGRTSTGGDVVVSASVR